MMKIYFLKSQTEIFHPSDHQYDDLMDDDGIEWNERNRINGIKWEEISLNIFTHEII